MNSCIRIARLASFAMFVCQPLSASPLPIGDLSFEANTLLAGDYSYDIAPEWIGTNGQNNFSAFEENITGFPPKGPITWGWILATMSGRISARPISRTPVTL